MKFQNAFRSPLASLTLFYLALPLIIFFIGWLKPVYALLAIVPLLFSGWHLLKQWPVEPMLFRWREIFLVVAFSLALTAFVGIGAFGYQDFDWVKHNAVLFDCIHLPWLIILPDGDDKWPLVYYLAYYLPAAVVGKFFGYAMAQIALWIWSAAGLALSIFWFARLSRLAAPVAAIAFFIFSGMDFFGNILVQITGLDNGTEPLKLFPGESWAKIWQFPSHYWMLQWSPGQAIAGWLAAGLFLAIPGALRLVGLGFLFTCAVLWSPFAAIGLLLLAFFLMWKEPAVWLRKNFFATLPLLLPLGMLVAFYAAKMSPEVAARFGKIPVGWFTEFHYGPGPWKSFLLLPLFIAFEFGFFLWFIFVRFQRSTYEHSLAVAVGFALILLLPITVGYESDLAMRASAVPLFCLAAWVARTVFSPGLPPRKCHLLWLIIVLGSLTPAIEAARQGHNLWTGRHDPRTVPHEVSAVMHMEGHDHLKSQYVGSTNSFFFRHLAKPAAR